jgi:hypothetical protein
MKRTLGVLILGLLVVSIARADVPPPKGSKRVTLDNKITTEKEYPDYIFFTVIGGGGKAGGFKGDGNAAAMAKGVTQVKFDPKTPIVIPGAGRSAGIGRQGHLTAVPKDAEKGYGSKDEFYAAIRAVKVEGQVRAKTNLDAITVVKDTDTRTTVVQEYKVEKVDPKDGIVLKWIKDGDAKDKQEETADETPGEPGVTAYTPRGGLWVAGMIASLGVLLAGLWLVTRCRSHRPG